MVKKYSINIKYENLPVICLTFPYFNWLFVRPTTCAPNENPIKWKSSVRASVDEVKWSMKNAKCLDTCLVFFAAELYQGTAANSDQSTVNTL